MTSFFRALFLVVSLSVALLSAGRGRAQAYASSDEEARALYHVGVAAYEKGRYREALSHFQRSYALSGRTVLLYNIATAAERSREDRIALESYRAFLEHEPDSAYRERVLTRIEELEAELERRERERLAAETAEAEAAAARERDALRLDATPPVERGPLPWIVTGVGGAIAVTGGVLLAMGLRDRAEVERAERGVHWHDGADAAYRRGPTLLTTSLVLLPLGAVTTATGLFLGLRKRGDDARPAALSIDLGPGSIRVGGRF